MPGKPARPIFVVGSPRSGTSILSWCLGHHPNIVPVPESNWMGDFAANVGTAYHIGAARGDYSILSAMDIQADELFAEFGRTINDLILRHRDHLEKRREATCIERNLDRRWLEASSRAIGPKERWVDGTPEYSFHICGLRKLFPEARFVHVSRDVRDVVRSMVNFHHTTGIQLVRDVEEAYQYWIRTVKACVMAERAYGSKVVHRVHYLDLVENRESTLRSLLEFLEEPYSERCLEPLDIRINSSSVPSDFQVSETGISEKILTEAKAVSDEIERTAHATEASPAAADALEADFRQRIVDRTNRGNARPVNQQPDDPRHNCAVESNSATQAVAPFSGSVVNILQQP